MVKSIGVLRGVLLLSILTLMSLNIKASPYIPYLNERVRIMSDDASNTLRVDGFNKVTHFNHIEVHKIDQSKLHKHINTPKPYVIHNKKIGSVKYKTGKLVVTKEKQYKFIEVHEDYWGGDGNNY